MRVQIIVEMGIDQSADANDTGGLERADRDRTRGATDRSPDAVARRLRAPSFDVDRSYGPVAIRPSSVDDASPAGDASVQTARSSARDVVLIRGQVEEDDIPALEAEPDVIRVWRDTPIAHFGSRRQSTSRPGPSRTKSDGRTKVRRRGNEARPRVVDDHLFGACPIPPCDCAPDQARGSILDVAGYLGVDRIWEEGITGSGVVVGIVDTGITAVGRPVDPSEADVDRVPNVIGGFPTDDWGTTGRDGYWHGNMTATDVLGMAPDASIYDIRLGSTISSFISDAIAGYAWAIAQHRRNGTPHILSNSWGIFQEEWDPVYANEPNHLFTRTVVDALDEGILVVFSAGNCGARCPDGRCGDDTGPGRSIWGANGHPRVMTVGAANIDEELIGYSSQGPAALDDVKPDFCSISHFEGYFDTDSGTSAAAPIAAGVVALLKQALPTLDQDQAKQALQSTAKPLGRAKWNRNAGAGIIQAKDAFDFLPIPTEPEPGETAWIAPVLNVVLA